ncbi:PilN domain-containing protein [SAR92 clade bacterium H455]|jgi:type IV pilus assembly protein PilN|uniref:PilN domain-containing protein n=1 Tax=SAR92 clade bacterium H455 TaxID=2974818 RepID=A0ABY5TQL7_9GAMM|nr:PilN domain-containing protein [SAR92 clade bacterium H455]
MTTINLLPWREEARELQRKAFLGKLIASALSGFALVLLWVFLAQNQLDNQNSRNSYLQSNIAEMDKKVAEISQLKNKKQEMLSRMKVIQDLQGNRSEIVKIFDELVRAVPDGTYLDSLELSEATFKVSGYSESNSRISTLMRNLDMSHKYANSNLTRVQHDARMGEQGSVFDLQVEIERPAPAGPERSLQ